MNPLAAALYGETPASSPATSTLTTSSPPAADLTTTQLAAQRAAQAPERAPAPVAQAAEPSTEEAITEKLFEKEPAQPDANPAIPENIKALREGDVERKLYGAQTAYSTAFTDADLVEAEGVTPEARAAVVYEIREMLSDTGLAPAEAREIVSIAASLRASPPTPEVEAEWQQETMKRLVEIEGSAEAAAAAISLAQSLVKRDPRAARMIELTRLGNHPRMVELVVQRARSEKLKGRL